jgi:hypothetical protein
LPAQATWIESLTASRQIAVVSFWFKLIIENQVEEGQSPTCANKTKPIFALIIMQGIIY